jgi:hypothetical protein
MGLPPFFTGNFTRMYTSLVFTVLEPYGLQFTFVDAMVGRHDLIGVY